MRTTFSESWNFLCVLTHRHRQLSEKVVLIDISGLQSAKGQLVESLVGMQEGLLQLSPFGCIGL